MMNKFKFRSSELEKMDAPGIPRNLLFHNLQELDFINFVFGGNVVSTSGIRKLLTEKNRLYHIVDIGCGGGGTMKSIAIWARKMGYRVKLTGVDKNSDAIDYMNYNCRDFAEISGVVCDYHDYLNGPVAADIIHCSLFCHHLNNDELLGLFRMNRSKSGIVVNDLRRGPMAYYCIKILTLLSGASVMAKNDGPLSVLRAFKSEELKKMLQDAEIENYSIERKWAFRYLVVINNDGNTTKAG